jgi:hypothetical protein
MSGEITVTVNPDAVVQVEVTLPELQLDVVAVSNEVSIDPITIEGPIGPAGPAGGNIATTAAVDCGGHKVVRAVAGGVAPASSNNLADLGKVVGVTLNAALMGDLIEYSYSAEIIEPSWNWTVGPIYLGLNGVPTQTPPTTGFIQQIGVATAPTKIVVSLGPPILLS